MRISPELEKLIPYKPGKPISETQREYGLKSVIKLASNENPLGPSPKAVEAAQAVLKNQHLYPDPGHYQMLQAVSTKWGLPRENLAFGNGSDELIDFLCRIYCEPGQAILTIPHAFAAYSISAQVNRAQVFVAPPESLVSEYRRNKDKIRLIFLPNPNNPTGQYLNETSVRQLTHELTSEEVLIVFDEAYNEFVRAKDYVSAQTLFSESGNLVVLRTFSKAYGLAGFRVGCMVAPSKTVEIYNRVRKPFNVNELAQVALVAALHDEAFMKKTQEITWKGLDYFYQKLQELGLPFLRSEGNFVLFDTKRKASDVYEALLRKGIILRPVLNYGFPRHLRMSVGLPHENEAAVQALKEVLAKIPEGD
ncbi:MAG: histidinol-phosphate transaminase [Bdellovibrionales bacterium]